MKRTIITIMFSGLMSLVLAGQSHAAYYLYLLPDGSKMVSDRKFNKKSYKLLRSSRKLDKIGKLASRKTKAEKWQPPAINYMRFENLIHQAANRHKVDAALVKAVIHTESYFNPRATSNKGAGGLMQLMPKTAARYGVTDRYSPNQNINAGTRYLSELLKRYKNSMTLALAAYNAGESAVAKYKGIPPYRETQHYVKKVMRYRDFYSDWP